MGVGRGDSCTGNYLLVIAKVILDWRKKEYKKRKISSDKKHAPSQARGKIEIRPAAVQDKRYLLDLKLRIGK